MLGINKCNTTQWFSAMMNEPDFCGRAGWLYRYVERHGIVNGLVMDESVSADVVSVKPFKEESHCINPSWRKT